MLSRWTMTVAAVGAAIMITIPSSSLSPLAIFLCLPPPPPMFGLYGRRRAVDRGLTAFWRHGQILPLVRFFSSPKRQYFREIGALSIVEVKKGLSSPSFPQPETSHTAAYLASSLPFPSSISFSSSSAAGRRRRRATSVLSAKRNPTPKDTKLA